LLVARSSKENPGGALRGTRARRSSPVSAAKLPALGLARRLSLRLARLPISRTQREAGHAARDLLSPRQLLRIGDSHSYDWACAGANVRAKYAGADRGYLEHDRSLFS